MMKYDEIFTNIRRGTLNFNFSVVKIDNEPDVLQ